MQYRVLKEFFYPTDAAVMRRLKAGDNPPLRARKLHHAMPGDVLALPREIVLSVSGMSGGPYVEEVPDGEA